MTPPSSIFVNSVDPSAIADGARSLLPTASDMLMVFVAQTDTPELATLIDHLRPVHSRFLGAVFPALLDGNSRHERGCLIIRLPALGEPLVISAFENTENQITSLGRHLPTGNVAPPTAVILVDGLAPRVSTVLEATYQYFGDQVHYWGGGAGRVDGNPSGQPCLFTAGGAFSAGAIIALCPLHAQLGVRHGWTELKGPLIATSTEGNVIKQLNWQPALEVYARHVSPELPEPLTWHNFSKHARGFPLGLRKRGNEFVVRDAIAIDGESAMVCVGDVPENAALSILRGDAGALIAAAGEAARESRPADDSPGYCCLLSDCISRTRFLGERFDAELSAINHELTDTSSGPCPRGVVTLGEISSRGDGYLEFFNMTCVVAVLHEY